MLIEDVGVLLQVKALQENLLMFTIFSKNHGLITGCSKKNKSTAYINPASVIHFEYKARLSEHLGYVNMEKDIDVFSSIAFNRKKLSMLYSLLSILLAVLNESEPSPVLYEKTVIFLNKLIAHDEINFLLKEYSLLECAILELSGYAMDLKSCAITGTSENLAYVSPKSGKAASLEAGLPYAKKLFKLPKYLINHDSHYSSEDIVNSLEMTSYFLNKWIFNDVYRNLPDVRYTLKDMAQED